MQIDWLTVTAQIVNFLILVWLLKHFLYRRVLNFMDQREKRITARLDDAEERERKAKEQENSYREKIEEFEQRREERLAEAREEAEREHRRLIEEARHEIDKQREKWRDELRREQDELRKTLKRGLAKSAAQIAQQTLADLADAGLEQQVVAAFIRRLKALPEGERKRLTGHSAALRLTSAFDLDQEARERLQDTFGDVFNGAVELDIARDPQLICGIELAGENQKVGWSVTDYLAEIDERIDDMIGAPAAERKET